MSQKNLIIFAVVSILVLLLANSFKNSAYEEYLQQKEQLVTFEKEAEEIGALKKRFGDKKSANRFINNLKRVASPSNEKNRGNSIIYDFDDLNNQKLNLLLRKIENSGIKIKELKITRVDPQKAKVRLEVLK